MKIVSVLGARPQFIKAAPVTRALGQAGHREILLHTGQHYDYGMSKIFFDELDIPEPDINLGVGSDSHAAQTGGMLMGIEDVLLAEKPDWTLVYGDTNSTLAGALAAAKLHIPVAHVEAGLRSYNREMPEEHNRVLTDHCADMLFAPTKTAVDNLAAEGISQGVHKVGDTMYDALLQFLDLAHQRSGILDDLGLEPKGYFLTTVHRPSNTDIWENLRAILAALRVLEEPVIFPVHPRARAKIDEIDGELQLSAPDCNVQLIEPVGYLDMLRLQENARAILTDSGGMQKEAYFLKVPCITLRHETEWVETVAAGWNILTGPDTEAIRSSITAIDTSRAAPAQIFGDGHAADRIAALLAEHQLS
ncbi:MAG: UDP-N-acetylglucosamine 2-epimerase (non-hydrolyzing) [Fidelibacterota bacterium]|nr:MAG: UDP-N-acetylglucosamine 2-epimerase (non-hydrolyzing) [Candidatus Neomarinimicrobiota bacterium]